MSWALRSIGFLLVALSVHVAVFARFSPDGAGESAGDAGAALISITASDSALSSLVKQWDQAPVPDDGPGDFAQFDPSAVSVAQTPPDMAVPDLQLASKQPPRPEPMAALTQPAVADTPIASQPPAPPPPVKPETKPAAKPVFKPATKPAAGSAAASPSQAARGAGNAGAAGTAQKQLVVSQEPGRNRSRMVAWGAEIRARIERKKRYPVAAQSRGQVGVVRVALSVRRSGVLQQVRIVGSSGQKLLDRAALRAVRDAAPFPRSPKEIFGKVFKFTLAVRFSL
jgi:periplasmic protein TonB